MDEGSWTETRGFRGMGFLRIFGAVGKTGTAF